MDNPRRQEPSAFFPWCLTPYALRNKKRSERIERRPPAWTNDLTDRLTLMSIINSDPAPTIKINVCRDEADNRILECALDGGADSIVTGDNDLLDLKTFKGIKIVRINDLPF